MRRTLALAIFEHVEYGLKLTKVKRILTRRILKQYGIRSTTEIRLQDWLASIKLAIELRRTSNIIPQLNKIADRPTNERVACAFGIG